jgi:hypothetical protein
MFLRVNVRPASLRRSQEADAGYGVFSLIDSPLCSDVITYVGAVALYTV